MLNQLKKIYNPSWFQGSTRKSDYFEGWYFKMVSHDASACWAFIPGISLNRNSAHAFVQALNGITGESWYFTYPLEAYQASGNSFSIRIGKNAFSEDRCIIDLAGENISIRGTFSFRNTVGYPATILRPGIMGWYRYVPFMECYHGVVSLNHFVDGELFVNQQQYRYKNGKGYIEKDWGTSMPAAWIWLQCNHFDDHGASFMLSVAHIPWLGSSFTGFLGFFLFRGTTHTFATYTGARIERLAAGIGSVEIRIVSEGYQIIASAFNKRKAPLKAPEYGAMNRIIHESVDSELKINMLSQDGRVLFENTGHSAGFEMVGDMNLLGAERLV